MANYLTKNNTARDLDPSNVFWECASNSKAAIVNPNADNTPREFKTIKQIEDERLASK